MPLQQVGAEQDSNYWMNLDMGAGDTSPIAASKEGSEILLSADEIPAKVRKPYTITKQRERWTDEEHQKFLEALKLHGRAWRRIEDHIGTKTAVQIRSHAQKFFSKLEREALTRASPALGSSSDIDIPPPRPKRKPTHPYPRKAVGTSLSTLSYEESSSRSPPAVCSSFKPLVMNPQVWQSSVKVSEDVLDKSDVSSSLRLFGQTVIVATDTVSSTDADHKRTFGSDAFAELGSTYPSNPHVSMDAEMSDHVSLPCTRYSRDLEKNCSSCEHEHIVSETRDSDSSIRLCHAGQYTTDVSATNSGPTVASKGSVQSGNEYLHPLQAFPGSFALSGSITDGSCFTPWHPSFAVARHQLKSSLQTLWERRPTEDFTPGQNEGANAAAAAAATFAMASAWQAMHGGVLPFHDNHPNMALMYNPSALGPTTIRPAMKRVKPISGLSSTQVENPKDVDLKGGIGMGNLRYDPKLCSDNAACLNVDHSCSSRDGASAGGSHNQPMSNTSDSETSDIIDAPTPKRRKTEAEQDGSMKILVFPSTCSVHSTHTDTVHVTKFSEKSVKNIDKSIFSKDTCKPKVTEGHNADSVGDANPEQIVAMQMSNMLSIATGESIEIDTPENMGIPLTAGHNIGITKESVSRRVTKADTPSDYMAKKCVAMKMPDGNGKTLYAGGRGGGCTGTEACSGSLLFMVPTPDFASRARSRYSGAGFIPYKKLPKTESRALGVDDAKQQLVTKIPTTS